MSDSKALQALRERMEYKRDIAKHDADEAERKLQAVITTMELLRTEELTEELVDSLEHEEDALVAELRKKKTQVQALVAIALKNNGKLLTKDAKRLLQRAKLMKQTKNANNILYNVINRSERFRHTGAGEYELITDFSLPRLSKENKTTLNELFPSSKPV